ncbi:MAG: S-methyl-5-thioribose-1-phosphate isomerase [Deltaproteobacteria bacterium]|jgi:methylthioribose-1-phosphate isomerase|nr:S-methyl-5-thioribose-1-phosphate isomerase [Deltaproteobacteria bacterium]
MLAPIAPQPEQKRLRLLDQRLLPEREEYLNCSSLDELIAAIKDMAVRGAPAIGVSAAWGCWLAALNLAEAPTPDWRDKLNAALCRLAAARPTAVNLGWAVERMRDLWLQEPGLGLPALITLWQEEARSIQAEDLARNHALGEHGAALLQNGDTVLTHCNAGALATSGFGTALGVIYAAVQSGKRITVIADETRPLFQGARLRAYELRAAGVEVRVACDNACALLMSRGLVQKVVVGADRIAANGDTANKIGTYGVALLARHFKIPFYVAAPSSSFDFHCRSGADIPLEERAPEEVACPGGSRIVPQGVPVYNFAFDLTPAGLISGLITERGVFTPPYARSLRALLESR